MLDRPKVVTKNDCFIGFPRPVRKNKIQKATIIQTTGEEQHFLVRIMVLDQ